MDVLSFDFEEEIQKQEAERQRLLESQGIGGHDGSSVSSVARGESRAKHSVVCRHWLKNMCIKGEFCEFIHEYDSEQMPACRHFYRYGYCADYERGNCPLKHEPLCSNSTDSAKPCIHYFLGFCRAGPRCKKKHLPLPAKDAPDVLPDWFLHLLVSNREIIKPADSETEEKIQKLENQCRQMSRSSGPNTTSCDDGSHVAGYSAREDEIDGLDVHRPVKRIRTYPIGGHVSNGMEEATGSHRDTQEINLSLQIHDPEDWGISLPPPKPSENKVKCFIIKSMRMENIYTSVQLGIWATGRTNTRKFEEAFQRNDHVLLFFSANESGGFQGIGRMSSLPDATLHSGIWGPISTRLGHNFRVQWLKQCTVEFEDLGPLVNPLNDNYPIKKSRDGQELPFSLAQTVAVRLGAARDQNLLSGTSFQPLVDHSSYYNANTLNPTHLRENDHLVQTNVSQTFQHIPLPSPMVELTPEHSDYVSNFNYSCPSSTRPDRLPTLVTSQSPTHQMLPPSVPTFTVPVAPNLHGTFPPPPQPYEASSPSSAYFSPHHFMHLR